VPTRRRASTGECGAGSAPLVSWNALLSPWLQVMDLGARTQRISVLDAISRGSEIHRIAEPSPLDLFAAHRFILTLLYWRAESSGGVEQLRKALLAGRVPRDLTRALGQASDHFSLFDPKRPFMQDPAVRDEKPLSACSLFAELSSGTNVAHFHHGDDQSSRLCLRCATLGLLRLAPWTQSGGRGKHPSVHGAPPIVAIAVGSSLCETLALNLVDPEVNLGTPQWTGQFKPRGGRRGITLLEGFTWNPRRVHLGVPQLRGLCANCGDASAETVGPVVYMTNAACEIDARAINEWRDPAVFYKPNEAGTAKTSGESDAALREDIVRLYERRFGKKVDPAPQSQVVKSNPEHRDWLVVMPCTNPANNKSFDHRVESITSIDGTPPPRGSMWYDRIRWRASEGREVTIPSPRPTAGMRRFVAAVAQLDDRSWGVLVDSANRRLDQDAAAFDIFTGIYWPLRSRDPTVPGRNAAWMALKIMATARKARPQRGSRPGPFRPWLCIETAASPVGTSAYRRTMPTGCALESELRTIIQSQLAQNPTTQIDWPGLCQFLHDTAS
jgi:hypothetical protein